jgi:hypothetical protein
MIFNFCITMYCPLPLDYPVKYWMAHRFAWMLWTDGLLCVVLISVSDPYSFFTDPDPEVEAGDQYGYGYGSGSGSNPDPGL